MRHRSRKNTESLRSMAEINMVPLMDLMTVLLIIFVITTPLLEQSMKLELPSGGELSETEVSKDDIATVEIDETGRIHLDKQPVSDTAQLIATLVAQRALNPGMVIALRADKKAPWGDVAAVMDGCRKNGMIDFSINTEYEPVGR